MADELARARPRVVLVDCFGTLLRRTVPSGRVREVACDELAEALGAPDAGPALVEARLDLERSLSRALSATGGPCDHHFDDLARALHERSDHLVERPDVEDFVALASEVEVAVEAALTHPADELVATLREARDAGAEVWVVSDTNLTRPMLGSLLAAHGLDDLVSRVVVSSEGGATKRSGALYEALLAELPCPPHEVVMVGDNAVADVERATEAGIGTCVLVEGGRWDATKTAPRRSLEADVAQRLDEIVAPTRPDDAFGELALTLWLFTARLDAALRRAGADRAVFLAREGHYLRDLFERLQARRAHAGRPPIDTSYLMTSRRSTFLPGMVDPARQLDELVAGRPELRWSDLLALVGLEGARLPAGVDPDGPVGRDGVARLLADPGVAEAIAARRAEQAGLLGELVSSAAPGDGPIHTVDVGWKGTARDQLARALGEDRPVHAHLLGLLAGAELTAPEHKAGHLFANRPHRTPHLQVFAHFKELYELLLAAPHGSAAAYRRAPDGTVVVDLDESEAERRCHEEVVGPLQARVARRFDAVSAVLAAEARPTPWLEDLVAAHHARMVYRPRAAELDLVERLVQQENFGARALRATGSGPAQPTTRGLRRHVAGGGWPPLRMRRAGADWQRRPYGLVKELQRRTGRLR